MYLLTISTGDSYDCTTFRDVLTTLDDRLRVILRHSEQVNWEVSEPSGLQHTGHIDVRQGHERYNALITLQLKSLKDALQGASSVPLNVITVATEW